MIPVNEPVISKNAKRLVLDCLNSGWVSSAGEYINKFEEKFAKYIGTKYAVTTTSGTSALHLALASIGVKAGDEVILPDLTIISCALAIVYLGARPVLVDVENSTGNIDPNKIEQKISKRTKAIIVVHLYGHPADMNKIVKIAKKHKLILVEDAAEAHGAEIKINNAQSEKPIWKKAGSLGDISCFSFYGNKIVTTGEGGMVITNNKHFYEKALILKDLAHSPSRRFYHEEIGFNYRMTNMQAALGLAQLGEIKNYLRKKRWMAKMYTRDLKKLNFLELPQEQHWAKSVYWMYAPLIKRNSKITRDEFCKELKESGVDTRTYFIPLHIQPVLKRYKYNLDDYPVSRDLSERGFYLPSGLAITENQIKNVVKAIKVIAKKIKYGRR